MKWLRVGSNGEKIHQYSNKPAASTFRVVLTFIHAFVKISYLINYVPYISTERNLIASFFALCQVQVPDKRWICWLVITNRTPSSGKRWVRTNPGMTTGRGKPKCSKKVYHFASLPIRTPTWSAREYDMSSASRRWHQVACVRVLHKSVHTSLGVLPAAQLRWTNDRGAQCESKLGEIGKIGGDKFVTCRAL